MKRGGSLFRRTSKILQHVFLILLTLSVLLPLFYILITSLKSHEEYLVNKLNLPGRIVLRNYYRIFVEQRFLPLILNSGILTAFAGLGALVISCLAAFAYADFRFPMRNALYVAFLSLMSVPPIVMITPLFKQLAGLHLVNTRLGVVLIYVGLTVPFSVYLLTSFFKTIPSELHDAARIDGCSELGYLVRVVLPLSKPSIATCLLVNGVWVWNELLIAVVCLQQDMLRTLMVGIMLRIGNFQVDVPLVTTGLVVASIPIMGLFFAFQKWFIRGLVQGAIKS